MGDLTKMVLLSMLRNLVFQLAGLELRLSMITWARLLAKDRVTKIPFKRVLGLNCK